MLKLEGNGRMQVCLNGFTISVVNRNHHSSQGISILWNTSDRHDVMIWRDRDNQDVPLDPVHKERLALSTAQVVLLLHIVMFYEDDDLQKLADLINVKIDELVVAA